MKSPETFSNDRTRRELEGLERISSEFQGGSRYTQKTATGVSDCPWRLLGWLTRALRNADLASLECSLKILEDTPDHSMQCNSCLLLKLRQHLRESRNPAPIANTVEYR